MSKSLRSRAENFFKTLLKVVQPPELSFFHFYRRNRVPHWVMEHLTKDMFESKITERTNQYQPDESIHEYFKSYNEDYLYSGYDRGHLAKAEYYKRSKEEMENAFVLSNIAPQVTVSFSFY